MTWDGDSTFFVFRQWARLTLEEQAATYHKHHLAPREDRRKARIAQRIANIKAQLAALEG